MPEPSDSRTVPNSQRYVVSREALLREMQINIFGEYIIAERKDRYSGPCIDGPCAGTEMTCVRPIFAVATMLGKCDIKLKTQPSYRMVQDMLKIEYRWNYNFNHWKCTVNEAYLTWFENKRD